MDLTVLGASGSYGSGAGGACSGYLVQAGGAAVWIDCGNGTFPNLQQHLPVDALDAVVLTHEHPDHCVDIYGLHVLLHYGLERTGVPVFGPDGIEKRLGALVSDWGDTFEWNVVGDGDGVRIGPLELRFSRTDHPPPTYAVEVRGDGKRLVYTADTGPDWTVGAFAAGADLVLSEATYQEGRKGWPHHLTAAEAGRGAREAGARRLVLTHLWPELDPVVSVAEGSEAFGEPVTLAAPHLVARV
ncbi:MAG TPA: MBL fold metallo-hydrolase [Acidimicrobiia bacterium]